MLVLAAFFEGGEIALGGVEVGGIRREGTAPKKTSAG